MNANAVHIVFSFPDKGQNEDTHEECLLGWEAHIVLAS